MGRSTMARAKVLPWLLAVALLVSQVAADDHYGQDDGGDLTGLWVFLAILFGIIFTVAWNSFYVVHQAEGILLLRIGKYHKTLDSGLNWVMPVLDKPYTVFWRRTVLDVNGKINDEPMNTFRIDLRESVFNLMEQPCWTKDPLEIKVNALLFYRIVDIKKAVFEVDDLQSAIQNTAQTQ